MQGGASLITQGIARAALIIMVGNATSRLLGLVREQVIAGLFGASAATDAFTAAGRIPLTLYDLLIGGMISAALVPVFSDFATPEHKRQFWRLATLVLSLAALALSSVAALFVFLAPGLISLFGPGFAPSTQAQAEAMLRFMLPAVVFMGLSGVLMAIHYSRQAFLLPAFAAAAFNAGFVAAAVPLHGVLGPGGLVAGFLLGSASQVALQLPGLKLQGLPWPRAGQKRRDAGASEDRLLPGALLRMGWLYLPVALGLVVSTIGVAIDTNLASRTGEGSLAALRFATTLTQLPLGLVAAAVSYAVLPTLSRQALEEGGEAFRRTLGLGLKMVWLAILPAAVGLVVLREPVVQLLFQHGRFVASDTARTALAFLAYSPGLPAAAVDQVLIFAFYARKNTVAPVLVGVFGVLVYLAVALSLITPLGMAGLALANSAQWVAHALVMLALARRFIGSLRGTGIGLTALRATAASAVMGSVLLGLSLTFAGVVQSGGLTHLVAFVAAAVILGGAIYLASLAALGERELSRLFARASDALPAVRR